MAGGPPAGYYLSGVIVDPGHRGHGIGGLLVRARIEFAWSAGAPTLYYFANSRNTTTIALHAKFGFHEIQQPFEYPGVEFEDRGRHPVQARLPVGTGLLSSAIGSEPRITR